VLVVGGGINGAGIARDLAGRGPWAAQFLAEHAHAPERKALRLTLWPACRLAWAPPRSRRRLGTDAQRH
jgi:glycine/D-amino acid oxidase-like deaminating enzyme